MVMLVAFEAAFSVPNDAVRICGDLRIHVHHRVLHGGTFGAALGAILGTLFPLPVHEDYKRVALHRICVGDHAHWHCHIESAALAP